MIVHELNVIGVPVAPDKADAPLLVDADRMLSAPLAGERLQPVAGRHAQVVEPRNGVEQEQRSATSRGTRFGALPAARSSVKLSLNDRIICKRTRACFQLRRMAAQAS